MDQRPVKMPQLNDLCGIPSSSNSNTFNNAFQLNFDSALQNWIFEKIAKMPRPTIESDRASMSSLASSVYSSMTLSPSTALSDSGLSSNRTVSPPPLRFFRSDRSSTERSYGIASIASSSEADRTPEKSPIADPGQVNSLCMNPWLPETVQPEVAHLVGGMLKTLQDKSDRDKKLYLESRAEELEKEPEFNPKKCRLSKEYKSDKEAADRKRNNEASRESRLKKKSEHKKTAMKMDFHRQENADMYYLHNWIEQDVYTLETISIDRGEQPENLFQLRRLYGFFPDQVTARIFNPQSQN